MGLPPPPVSLKMNFTVLRTVYGVVVSDLLDQAEWSSSVNAWMMTQRHIRDIVLVAR